MLKFTGYDDPLRAFRHYSHYEMKSPDFGWFGFSSSQL